METTTPVFRTGKLTLMRRGPRNSPYTQGRLYGYHLEHDDYIRPIEWYDLHGAARKLKQLRENEKRRLEIFG